MTKQVKVGPLLIGGNAPVSVQTMYDIPLSKLEEKFSSRMGVLKAMGCDIIRFSYPDVREHDALCKVVRLCPMPVVADIHFDYKNALDAMDCGVAKIRINPGNIGERWKTEEVVRKALDKGVAIRIGLNSGSLPHEGMEKGTVNLMVDTALEYISWFENLGFYNTVVSLKASDSALSYEAAREFSRRSDYPMHLGVTEAGGVVSSCVKSTWTLGRLLEQGIGGTIRYSITGSIEDEVQAGAELLRTLGLRKGGMRIVSCPMCGRCSFNSQGFLREVEHELLATGKDICVAIMGCQVNGPGEAKGADIAVTGIGNKVYLYMNGEIYKEIDAASAREELLKAVAGYGK
ncbi:MAG: flavodoxin-dependent (E)-4-hydroxy-3-methylbut-2-enyl-diphosphate synthase [Spirochaetales bacterium]|nr:flavodoxin-dependent (E)-4-hydroxy-3-methylbut-2-enyl-diphosphate synthase [Spirochaetales bacterium]